MMESSQLQGMTYLGRFLSYLFQELNENNLPYCVLRNHDLLPNHTDNDVDILIEQRHVALCVRTALKIAEEQELILLRCQRRLGIVKLWLVSTVNISSQEDPEVIIIDFWSSALWRGTPIADMQYVLSSQ